MNNTARKELRKIVDVFKKIKGGRRMKKKSKWITEYELSLIESLLDRALVCGLQDNNYRIQWNNLVLAHKQLNLDLEELLLANDQDFTHDFLAIQEHVNSNSGRIEDGFVPHFIKTIN